MAFADSVEVDNIVGNKIIKNSAGTDITATVIVDAINRGDSRVKLETGYSGWVNTDDYYASVQEASEYFAGAYILERYFDDKEKAMMFYQKGLDICYSLAKGATQSVIVQSTSYRSFPLNPLADIYRSIPAGASEDDSTLEG